MSFSNSSIVSKEAFVAYDIDIDLHWFGQVPASVIGYEMQSNRVSKLWQLQ